MYDCEKIEDAMTRVGYIIKNAPLESTDGLCMGHRVAIREDIPTLKKRADVLAEEWAHGELTVGNITDQTIVTNRRQERKARMLSYSMRLPLLDIVKSYKEHRHNIYEMSEFLGVSEDTILDSLNLYRQVYGEGILVGDYFVQFEPTLQVYEYFIF